MSGEPRDTYYWYCPRENGTFGTKVLMMSVEVTPDASVLRVPTNLVHAPILLVDYGDPYVKTVAEHILSVTEGYSDYLKVYAALSFVQTSITYVSDPDLYGCEEYWAKPAETLRYHAGDCEDTSVLLVSILGAMGIESVLLDYPGHIAVGVLLGDSSEGYLYCETARDTVLQPGLGAPDEEPVIYVPGSFPVVKADINGLVAGYRDLIRKVTGA